MILMEAGFAVPDVIFMICPVKIHDDLEMKICNIITKPRMMNNISDYKRDSY